MPQSELTAHYAMAHVIADQFGDHLVGLAGYEAMAMGRPLLCKTGGPRYLRRLRADGARGASPHAE